MAFYHGRISMPDRIVLIGLILLCALCSSASAEVEDWYTFWSIGFASINYPGELNEAFDSVDSLPGVTRTTFTMDIFGFYWPLENKQTIMGVVVNNASDNLGDDNTTFSLNQYLYSFSTMHFFGSEPGDGFLLRGDIGMSSAVMTISGGGSSFEDASDSGVGFLLGIGYGYPVSEGSRIIFSLNLASRDIEGDNISTIGLTIGGLW
jgi:hypothetical protein